MDSSPWQVQNLMARAEYLKEHIKVGRAVPGVGICSAQNLHSSPHMSLPLLALFCPYLWLIDLLLGPPVASLLPLTLAASGPTDERVPPGG